MPLQNILNFPMVSSKSFEVADQPLGFWKIPSVSKVLNVTMSEDARAALDRWQANLIAQLGEQGFQEHKASKFYDCVNHVSDISFSTFPCRSATQGFTIPCCDSRTSLWQASRSNPRTRGLLVESLKSAARHWKSLESGEPCLPPCPSVQRNHRLCCWIQVSCVLINLITFSDIKNQLEESLWLLNGKSLTEGSLSSSTHMMLHSRWLLTLEPLILTALIQRKYEKT